MAQPNGPADATMELAQTGKRDHLRSLEKSYQKMWQDQKLFEIDMPEDEEGLTPEQLREKYPKWMGTFPFPYMNGSLHLGHGFTFSKIEFAVGYQRMLGKRALFPHAFHVTGMPIKAASDKIIREMEMFGQNFENFNPEEVEVAKEPLAPASAEAGVPVVKDKAKKGKVAAKATGAKYQFQIMESIGVPREEIKKFADPYFWTKYFPPIAIEDQNAFGSRIDWRRSFMTTDANPYYDSFVRWQMNRLHEQNKIKFGERYTIYSPKDGQPCMDHDRADGEGVNPQEYLCIKLTVLEWGPNAKHLEEKAKGKKVHLIAATLRPETMYGQTNCYVGPSIKYGLFDIDGTDLFLCTHRAARNMAFQKTAKVRGQVNQICEVDGSTLPGTRIKPPFGIYPEVYVLPMESALATKGTGVVTSVPSDSPDDYQTLLDLRKKPEYFKIDPKWVALDPVPVLNTPAYGEMSAPAVIKTLKIQSHKDSKQLAEAKDLVYKEAFYNGTMTIREFKGESCAAAKVKVKNRMVEQGLAFEYAEPAALVMSRSADECVVALMDQWYLDYGETEWKAVCAKLIAQMELYIPETRNAFEKTLDWLYQWACARTYGLGSKMPWDHTFMVESLSDSTIYMAYYSISHMLHGGTLDGSKVGSLGVTPDQLTDEVWDHIFGSAKLPDPSPIDPKAALKLRNSFRYWYPMDIRSSGKDLINNHLMFCTYVHAAMFPEEHWPRSMRMNGHLTLNGKKMSKSTGNFLTVRECLEKYGADATRLSLADAGDGLDDANFDEKTSNATILRLHTLMDWCEETYKESDKLRTGPKASFDRVFEEEIKQLINTTKEHYEKMEYKDALKYGFYEMQLSRDWYREATADVGMHKDLALYWIRVAPLLVLPLAPHFAEHIWQTVLKEPKSVQLALWPTPAEPVNVAILESGVYMRKTIKAIRDAELQMSKKKGKGKETPFNPKGPKSVRIFVASKFPDWQDKVVEAVQGAYDPKEDKVDDGKVRELLVKSGLIKDKRAMPFAQVFKKRIATLGAEGAFNRTLPFSEVDVLRDLAPYLKRTLILVDIDVYVAEDAIKEGKQGPGFTKHIIELAEPGQPSFEFMNV